MATPRKTYFDVGQRVRLTQTCDGIHSDGETAVRVGAGTLVEITKDLGGNHYHAKYAQWSNRDWAWGFIRLEFQDAQTVLGRPLFPGALDQPIQVRPQDQDGSGFNASGMGSSAAKGELGSGQGMGEAEGTSDKDREKGEGKGTPQRMDPNDMTPQELADALADDEASDEAGDEAGAGSPQDSAATTSDDETDNMNTEQQNAAKALAEALTTPAAGGDAEAPPPAGDGDLESRVARLEQIDAKQTTPVRDHYPKLVKEVKRVGDQVAALTPPLLDFMKVTGQNMSALQGDVKALQSEMTKVAADAASAAVKAAQEQGGTPTEVVHVFQTPTQTFQTQKGDRPEVVETLFRIGCGITNIQWVGPAGCGKTSMAAIIAVRLGLEVGDATCSPGMSETIWTGRLIPNIATGVDNYKVSLFAHLFEHGGVFLADEMDNSDPASLLAINTALANGYFTLPDGRRILRHANFIMVSAMNTYGSGADRVYVGRAQLDGASLDRYMGGVITVGYDKQIELGICGGTGDKASAGQLYKAVMKLRADASKAGIRQIISTRWIIACVKLMSGGMTIPAAFRVCAEHWSENDRVACGITGTTPAAVAE